MLAKPQNCVGRGKESEKVGVWEWREREEEWEWVENFPRIILATIIISLGAQQQFNKITKKFDQSLN